MTSRPAISGRRVLVTASDPERLCELLHPRGAVAIAIPTIEIRSLTGGEGDAALARLGTYDWIVVTSPNGAAAAFDRMKILGIAAPPAPRWAAVGPGTRAALQARGVRVDHVPEEGRSDAIPDRLGETAGARVLLLRARAAGRELPRILRARGAEVDDVAVYETIEGPEPSREPLRRALAEGIDAAVFTSGSTVRGLVRLVGDPARALAGAALLAIGPVTARAIGAAGLGTAIVAAEPTPESLVRALEEVEPARA